MKKINNPNDIVEEFVTDYKKVFGEHLVSVILYGSAVTHEYKPGKSDINIAIVLGDNSIAQIGKSLALQKKWNKRGVTAPFFLTEQYIMDSCDTYPLEYLDMRSNYRVLFGEDVLQKLELTREHIRLQCERELRGVAIHLRRSFVQCAGNDKLLAELLSLSIRKLLPVFKGLLVLKGKSIPKSKSEIISSVEDVYNLGASALSGIYNSVSRKTSQDYDALFNTYANNIDALIVTVDSLTEEGS